MKKIGEGRLRVQTKERDGSGHPNCKEKEVMRKGRKKKEVRRKSRKKGFRVQGRGGGKERKVVVAIPAAERE